MILYNNIQNNFTTLLRAGSFGITDTKLQPMSLYKWRRLQTLASQLGISGYIAAGMQLLKDDEMLPQQMLFNCKKEQYDASHAHIYNIFRQNRLRNIKDDERHSIDTSVETLEFLDITIANAHDIITHDLNINGVIAFGNFLKTKGDKVDFVKYEEWIRKLGVDLIVSFLASLLMELFGFESTEFEFLQQPYNNAITHYNNILRARLIGEKHEFRYSSRLNIAMIETISYRLALFIHKIKNIEE